MLAVVAFAAPPPALAIAGETPRSVQQLWDAYPLDRPQGRPPASTGAGASTAPLDTATGGSDDIEVALLACALALVVGGVAGWVVSLRPPRRRLAPVPVTAGPVVARVRATTPPLWAPSGSAPTSEPAAPPPAHAIRPTAPPAPANAWAAEVGWHLVDGASQFRVTARPVEGGGEPVLLGTSALLDWPPNGARSVQALTDAVKLLETELVAAGWTPLASGSAWYAKRFTWQPGARPPTAAPGGRVRHRWLYDAEYARQVERTRRLRQAITTRVIGPPRQP